MLWLNHICGDLIQFVIQEDQHEQFLTNLVKASTKGAFFRSSGRFSSKALQISFSFGNVSFFSFPEATRSHKLWTSYMIGCLGCTCSITSLRKSSSSSSTWTGSWFSGSFSKNLPHLALLEKKTLNLGRGQYFWIRKNSLSVTILANSLHCLGDKRRFWSQGAPSWE